jgi:hypothetical protein
MPEYSLKYSRRALRTALLAFFLLILGRALGDNSKIPPGLQPVITAASARLHPQGGHLMGRR